VYELKKDWKNDAALYFPEIHRSRQGAAALLLFFD
jgi:hypothetical protein